MATVDDHQSKKCHITGGIDIISELPRNVIDRILELMPIQDAVRTSALARNWRYNWTTISKLKFNKEFIQFMVERSVSRPDICRIITNVLLLHQSNILCFDLDILDMGNGRMGDIDNWILFLSRKGVKELTLLYPDCFKNFLYMLPSHLYSCLNLTHLDLWGCIFIPPPSFGGFPNLIRFDCLQVILEKDSFRCFTSCCPLLQIMILQSCFGSFELTIHSPSLEHLRVDCYRLRSLCIDVENLKALHVDGNFSIEKSGAEGSNMMKIFHGLPKIEVLNFRGDTFRLLAAGGAPRRLPTPLSFLKRVIFNDLDFQDPAQNSCVLSVIQSAPNLQELEIETLCCGGSIKPVSIFLGEDYTLSRLQKVTLYLIRTTKIEMAVIKSLLACSPSLEVMSIFRSKSGDAVIDSKNMKKFASEKTMQELAKFHRASPKVEMNFCPS